MGATAATAARRPPDRRERGARPATTDGGALLERLAVRWQRALDSAGRALEAAYSLPRAELGRRAGALAAERAATARALALAARADRIRRVPWLSPAPVTPRLLGLPPGVRACVFDLERVLSDSGVLHAQAWTAVFDRFLLDHSARTDWRFVPFDPHEDYPAYLEARPRLDGILAFLHSRGIDLPEGEPDDPSSASTAFGLARRKNEALAEALRRRRVVATADARAYLEAAGRAGLGRAVVAASEHMARMLDLAGLTVAVDVRIDAHVIRAEHLQVRPKPDVLLAACRHLGARATESVAFTSMPAGVAAGRAAGVFVIGVAGGPDASVLGQRGADHVVPSLSALLDPALRHLAEASPPAGGPSTK